MNGFEGIICGLILAFIVGEGWRRRDPQFLYMWAAFGAFAGLANYTGNGIAGEAPYVWGFVAFFVIVGLCIRYKK